MIRFFLNCREIETPLPKEYSVLDFLRRNLRLTGTKEACREGDCGACLVLCGERTSEEGWRYHAVNSCLLTLGHMEGQHLVTIEGLNGKERSPIQRALEEEGGIQCGFCTPGMVVALTGFFLGGNCLDEEEMIEAVGGNICRCTGYTGIRRAVTRLCLEFDGDREGFRQSLDRGCLERIRWCAQNGLLPPGLKQAMERYALTPLRPTVTLESFPALSRPIAGGTDLLIQREKEQHGGDLLFLHHPRLQPESIRQDDGGIAVDAVTTMENFRQDPLIHRYFPEIREWFRQVASQSIRHQATIGGNIVNASPIGDVTILLLTLDADLLLQSRFEQRRIPLRDFFLGYKRLDMAPGEILRTIQIPLPSSGARFNMEKVSRRRHLDIAGVNSAAFLETTDGILTQARISAGGVAPVPLLLRQTGSHLLGKPVTPERVQEATRIAQQEISPISDVRGSERYKRVLLSRLILAHFLVLFPSEMKTCSEEGGLP